LVRFIACGCAIATILAPSAANSQDINETVTIEDLGFTQRLTAGARPTALSGAYAGLGVDAHSLFYNPAGLVGVAKPEFHLGFGRQEWTLDNRFYGTYGQTQPSATKFDDAVFAFPVPTVRGRLVLAGGVYRTYSAHIDILNRGFNTNTATNDDYLLQQSGSIYSYNFGGAFDVSPRISVGANLFFLHGRVNALTQFTYEFVPQPPPTPRELERETLVDDALVDVNGVGAVFGISYQTAKYVTIGFAIGTPTAITIRGDAVQDDALYFSSPPDEFYTEGFVIDTDYKLPFYAEGGISFVAKHLLVTLEAEFWNWAEAEINGRQIKDENLQAIFKDVVNFRGGVELILGALSLRGGYAYTPYPLEYLQADRIEGTQITRALASAQPQSVSGGIGLRIAEALTLDASAEYMHGERTIPTLIDKREMYRVVFGASFRI
jgi:long-subunit fatty acid transport protein